MKRNGIVVIKTKEVKVSKITVLVWDYEDNVQEVEIGHDFCNQCGTKLGKDCGEAEIDYNDEFCSVGCYKTWFITNYLCTDKWKELSGSAYKRITEVESPYGKIEDACLMGTFEDGDK